MAYKILIVDDSKLARMYVERALKVLHPDYVRVEAGSADEAILHMKSEKPDIALVDINMPGKDGLTLASELLALNPQMPLAIVSANNQDEIIEQTRVLGVAFLAKPLTERTLSAFLADATRQIKESTG